MDEKITPDTTKAPFQTDSLLTVSTIDPGKTSKTNDILYPVLGILVLGLLLIVLFNNRSH